MGLVRRDPLLGLFWSEHDAARARASLRQALYEFRQELGQASRSVIAVLTSGVAEGAAAVVIAHNHPNIVAEKDLREGVGELAQLKQPQRKRKGKVAPTRAAHEARRLVLLRHP